MRFLKSCCVLAGVTALAPVLFADTILNDDFSNSSLNSLTPSGPAPSSTAYHLFSSKTWNPSPAIGPNDLRFGIGVTTSGHIETHALFSTSPVTLTNLGDYLELVVTFWNASGLFAQAGHVGFGLYNCGGVSPIAGGMNSTAVASTVGVIGGAQGWQGYVSRFAYNGGNHRIATRPAQSSTTGNNQDLITEGSGSQSYTGAVSLASSASTLSLETGVQLTAVLRLTIVATGTLQIDSRLYLGANTNGTLLVGQTASASGANLLTTSFDALGIGWRATANTFATVMDIESIRLTTSLPIGGPSDTVAGIYFHQQPTNVNVGVAISPAVAVGATNATGLPVTNAQVTLSLANGTGPLNGTPTQVTTDDGVATFANLSLGTPGAKQFRAACGTNNAISSFFNITGDPVAVTALSPANNAANCCVDTLLKISFDKPVQLQRTGAIRIYETGSPAAIVDTIDLSANVDNATSPGTMWNTATNVQPRTIGGETFTNHPVIISGNVATVFPHSGVLSIGHTYHVLVDSGVFTDTNGIPFPGITSPSSWQFSTKATGPANPSNLIVAADGSGDFCTVQGAVDYIPDGNTAPRLISIRDGMYTEIVNVNNRHRLTFRGQSRSNTIIACDNNSTVNGSTHYRMVFKVNADDVALDSLTITNGTPKGGSQAEALMVESDRKRFVAFNVRLCSFQDTLLLNTSGTQCYFQDSLIQGDTDFIWGGGNAFLTNCEIRSLFSGYLTQPRTTVASNGMSFVSCRLTSPGSISATLGRSLNHPDGNAAFINCLIDSHITGWTDLNTRYWEYGNSNITQTAAATYNGTQLATASLELTNARSATLWLYGWVPSLLPNIISQPTNVALAAGLDAVFAVTATGIPPPFYQWRKNGIDIVNATNAVFTITDVVPGDAATYSVLVSTPAGSILSSNASLVVNLPAFPGAEGAGAYSLGGRGGDVYYVTSLADNGAGSLRNGISTAPTDGRTILFKVSGNIALGSTLTVNRPRITVAGQTAPGDGICLQNYSFNISANDVIVRHLRTRLGTNSMQEADSIWINSGTNVIVDHISASWSVDETLSASGNTANLTVQWCYITESLNHSIHSKGAHGYGSLITPSINGRLSWHHNLYAHHNSRNPRPGTDKAATVILDFRNNLIYNYGDKVGYGSDWDPDPENLRLNYVGNYVVAGPDSAENYVFQGGGTNTIIYQASNLHDLDLDNNFDGVNNSWAMFNGTYVATDTPFSAPPVATDYAPVALQRVLAQAGAMPWRRDSADVRVTETVRNHLGSIIDSTAEVGGWPVLTAAPAPADTDSDGMPDYWEMALGLNPSLASDGKLANPETGYTRLEDYLNWLAEPHVICHRNGLVNVNLRTMTGSTSNLTYTVANGANGTVNLLADGYTARFMSVQGYSGPADFTFAATATSAPAAVTFGPVSVGVLVTITNANLPPVLAPITDRTVTAGGNVDFTCEAFDPEAPPQTISFVLLGGPLGAALNTNTGTFHWRPAVAQGGTTNSIAIVAMDNGTPSLTATQQFTITVLRPVRPTIFPVSTIGGQFALSVDGDYGPDYTLQASTNLSSWIDVYATNSPMLPFLWIDPNSGSFDRRFFRSILGP